jgi:hypothetical protein
MILWSFTVINTVLFHLTFQVFYVTSLPQSSNIKRLMKPIVLSKHAREQLIFRGTTEDEVIKTIETSSIHISSETKDIE